MMKAIWLEDNKLSLRSIPIPEPPKGEALVRVILAGICATDLELVKGYYPYTGVLGHEFVGEVVQADERPDLVGERVVGEINVFCGACRNCLRGDHTHCEKRTVLGIVNRDGAFAEYLSLPIENLLVVPKNVSDEKAVFTEPLAAAYQILEQVEINANDRVLLIGAGRLGQLIARALASTGCQLEVSARYETQRKLLAEVGIKGVDAANIQPDSYDFVVEATGSSGGFGAAVNAVRPRGALILKSTYAGSVNVDLSRIVVEEITLVGSRCGAFAPALTWLSEEKVDPSSFIHARYELNEGLEAFDHASKQGVIKVLLDIGRS